MIIPPRRRRRSLLQIVSIAPRKLVEELHVRFVIAVSILVIDDPEDGSIPKEELEPEVPVLQWRELFLLVLDVLLVLLALDRGILLRWPKLLLDLLFESILELFLDQLAAVLDCLGLVSLQELVEVSDLGGHVRGVRDVVLDLEVACLKNSVGSGGGRRRRHAGPRLRAF